MIAQLDDLDNDGDILTMSSEKSWEACLLEATSTFFSYFEEDFGLDRLFSLSYH
jgi:hypothetical protein